MTNQLKEKLWTKDFIIIILINFFVFLNHLMILSTFPFFVSYLGYSDSISGICATIFSLVAVICRPFIGWMLDNGKRKMILCIGICGMMLMPMGYLLIYTTIASIFLSILFRMTNGCALAFEDFLFLQPDSLLYNLCCQECQKVEFTPNIAYTGQRAENIIDLVEKGMGVSLLMKKTIHYLANPKISLVEIKPTIYLSKVHIIVVFIYFFA